MGETRASLSHPRSSIQQQHGNAVLCRAACCLLEMDQAGREGDNEKIWDLQRRASKGSTKEDAGGCPVDNVVERAVVEVMDMVVHVFSSGVLVWEPRWT